MAVDKMKILLTGSQGQLGQDVLTQLTLHDLPYVATDRLSFDLTNPTQMLEMLDHHQPTHIFHCAAYTQVDKAEVEQERCYQVNVEATRLIVDWANQHSAKLIFFSTDYVFDGQGQEPFDENTPPNPINYYGWTKREAEKLILTHMKHFAIYRVSWLYGLKGRNFVYTISNLLKTRDHLEIVSDQIGTPTLTHDLAVYLINHFEHDQGVLHIRNEGYMSWYEFACNIRSHTQSDCVIHPITSQAYQKPHMAKRPLNSRLGSLYPHTTLRPVDEALTFFMSHLHDDVDA